MLAAFVVDSVMWWFGAHPFVCLSRWHTYRDTPVAAYDMAIIHFGPTTRRTDVFVKYYTIFL